MQHSPLNNGNNDDPNHRRRSNYSGEIHQPEIKDNPLSSENFNPQTDFYLQTEILAALEERLSFRRFITVKPNEMYSFYRIGRSEDSDFLEALDKLSEENISKLAEKLCNKCLKDPRRLDVKDNWMAGEVYLLSLRGELSSPVLSKRFIDTIKYRFISNLDNNNQNLDKFRELSILDIFLNSNYLRSEKVVNYIERFICKELEQRPLIAFSLLNTPPLGKVKDLLVESPQIKSAAEKAVIKLLECGHDDKILTLRLERKFDAKTHSIPNVVNGLITTFDLGYMMHSPEYISAAFHYMKKVISRNDLTDINHSLSILPRNPDNIAVLANDSKVILNTLKQELLSALFFEFREGSIDPNNLRTLTKALRNFTTITDRKSKSFLQPLKQAVLELCKSKDPAVDCHSLASLVRLVPESKRENFISGKIWSAVSRRFDKEVEELTEYLEDIPGLSDNSMYATDSELDYDKYLESRISIDAFCNVSEYKRLMKAAAVFGIETWNVPPFPEPLSNIAELFTPITEALAFSGQSHGVKQDYRSMPTACWRASLFKAQDLYIRDLKSTAALITERAYNNVMRLNNPDLEKHFIADMLNLRAYVNMNKNSAPLYFNQAIVFHLQVIGCQNLSLATLLDIYSTCLQNTGEQQASKACIRLSESIQSAFIQNGDQWGMMPYGTSEVTEMKLAFEEFESDLIGIPKAVFAELLEASPRYIEQQ